MDVDYDVFIVDEFDALSVPRTAYLHSHADLIPAPSSW